MEFTLGQVVTSVKGEYLGELEGGKQKKDTRMKIFAEEKKAGYGSKIATFGIEYNYNQKNKNLFIVLNKIRGKSTYSPVYKTDCKTVTNGRYVFTDI